MIDDCKNEQNVSKMCSLTTNYWWMVLITWQGSVVYTHTCVVALVFIYPFNYFTSNHIYMPNYHNNQKQL